MFCFSLNFSTQVFILLCIAIYVNLENCNDPTLFYDKYLGTKTAYRFIENHNSTEVKYEGCKAKKIWMVIRHGTRAPSAKQIRNMKTTLYEIRGTILKSPQNNLCLKDIDRFQKWNVSVSEDTEKFLSLEGEREMTGLAQRIQQRFPNVLSEKYNKSSFLSKHHFAVGLFGRLEAGQVEAPPPVYKDPVLRFYKLCKKWKQDVKDNLETLAEKTKFEALHAVQALLKNVTMRLGLEDTLSMGEVQNIFTTCGFESAWNPKDSPSVWCSAFSKEEMQLLDYCYDLKYYWIDGYGYELSYKQACSIIVDLAKHLTSKDARSVFYFTHSGTILKTLAHLGLYKDSQPLLYNNYNAERLWRVGKIDAFASNLAFVLFECKDGPKVLTLHQEVPVTLPGCPEEDLCPLDVFLSIYDESIHKCQFQKMCEVKQT